MQVRTADTLAFLLGTWDLERAIDDYRSGSDGLFRGSATLVQSEAVTANSRYGQARYQESGELRFGTQVTRASRTLVYERLPDTSVMLHFADGKPFVDLNLESGEWRALHHCVDDLYELTTTVRSASVVEERWRVSGPTKDYLAVTTLTRVA